MRSVTHHFNYFISSYLKIYWIFKRESTCECLKETWLKLCSLNNNICIKNKKKKIRIKKVQLLILVFRSYNIILIKMLWEVSLFKNVVTYFYLKNKFLGDMFTTYMSKLSSKIHLSSIKDYKSSSNIIWIVYFIPQ